MGLFGSIGRKHLNGHKELTKHAEIIDLSNSVKKVYFPTMAPNGKPINFVVKEGDKVKVGTLIGNRTDFEVPIYSSVSGTVLANENVLSVQVGRNIPHLVIENDGTYESEKLPTVSLDDSKEAITAAIKTAGLVGLGGAGFPTYIKYNNPQGIETLIVNGVECEPFLTTDFVTTINDAEALVKGCQLLMKASGATNAVIAMKVHKEEARDAVNEQIKNLGCKDIKVVEVPDVYPMGWERVLIKQVTKKEYDRLPSEAHCVISNAQTVISLSHALLEGSTVSKRLVTVSGDGIKTPANVLCPVGTLACDLIEACGGYDGENINLIPGGPMCSKAVANDKFPLIMQMGALTVLKFVAFNSVSCLRCGECTMHCPANLQPVEIQIAYKRKDIDRMTKLNIMSCVECGMCSYVCPSKIDVTDNIKKAKMIYRLQHK